jgi:hypothetical protein
MNPNVMEGEAYDRAMDEMTRGQRNKLMGHLPPPRQRASPQRGKHEQVETIWHMALRMSLGSMLQLTGYVFEGTGAMFTYVGRRTRELGQALVRPRV